MMARLLGTLVLALCASMAAVHADEDEDIKVEPEKKAPEPAKKKKAEQVFLTADNLAVVTEDENWKPWVVLFQDEEFDQAKATATVFAELESKSADMLSFATVKTSTKEGKALAKKQGWKQGDAGTVIKVFARPDEGFGTREGSWLPAGTKTDMKSLYGVLTGKLKSDVTIIEDSQELGQFVSVHKKGLPKVFLFSKKTEPTALYNAMAMEFEGRLDLSIIGDKNEDILKQFNVAKFPSLMVMAGVTQSASGEQQVSIQQYPGKKFQFKPIKQFLNRFALKPSTDFPKIVSQQVFEKECGTAPCMLLLTTGKDQDTEIKRLAKKAAGGVFHVKQIDTKEHPDVAAKLEASVPSAVMVAALMTSQEDPEPKMYLKRATEEGADFSASKIEAFMKETEALVMQTAQTGGSKVSAGLDELDSLPTLWGDSAAKAKPKKKSAKAILAASATFNLTKNLYNTLVKPSAHVWLMLVCPGGTETGCPTEGAMYEDLSKTLRSKVWCGAIDASDPMAPEGASTKKASVYLYGQGRDKKEDPPKLYTGAMEAKALEAWALDHLPKTEDGLDASSFETFVQKIFGSGSTVPSALVFYDPETEGATEKEVAPVCRALGYQFPVTKFGMVTTKEALNIQGFNFASIIKKTKPPTLLLMFLQPQQDPETGKPLLDEKTGKPQMGLGFQPYQGQWEMGGISRFLKMHNKPEDGGRVLEDIGIDPSIYRSTEVKQATHTSSVAEVCGEGRLCAIALIDSYDSHHKSQIEVLEGVALQAMAKAAKGDAYESTPVIWIDSSAQGAYLEAFNVASVPTVVVWNPATGDYGEMRGAYDVDKVFRFVDQATRFTKRYLTGGVMKELPALVEPMAPVQAEEDDFDLSELMGDVMGGDDVSEGDDDDDDDYDNPNERGPARLKKKKKKKKKDKKKKDSKDTKKKKGKKGKQEL